MKSFPHTMLVVLLAALPLCAQNIEMAKPFFAPEQRRFFASDVTGSNASVMVNVGDGVVYAVPGGPFTAVTAAYGDKLFDGVALFSATLGLVSTTDGLILPVDLRSRALASCIGFPARGGSVVRCGTFAFAIRDGVLIRFQQTDNCISETVLPALGSSLGYISSASSTRLIAADTITNTLHVIDAATGSPLQSRSYSAPISFLQALSDSCSVVITSGSAPIMTVLWHHSPNLQVLPGFYSHPSTRIMARFTASDNGGGAVVLHAGPGNRGKRQIIFARGAQLDSIEHSPIGNERTRVVHSGVAAWNAASNAPQWNITAPFFLRTTLTTEGTIAELGSGVTPRNAFERRVSDTEQTLHCGNNLSLLTVVDMAPFDTPSKRIPFLVSSIDGGHTWSSRALSRDIRPLAISDDGTLLAVKEGTIHVGNVQSDATRPVLTPRYGFSGATMQMDTILVAGHTLYRSYDRGRTWDSSAVDGYAQGPVAFARNGTVVLGGTPLSCITTNAGATWRSFSFITPVEVTSATVLADGTVLGVFNNTTAMSVATCEGRVYGTTMPTGTIFSFANDSVYVGTARGMRLFDLQQGRLTTTTLAFDPYALRGNTKWLSSGTLSATPDDFYYSLSSLAAHNGRNKAWFLIGDRIKIIEREIPASVQETFPDNTATVFPNPASTSVTVQSGEVTLFTMDGKVILQVGGNADRTIDIRAVPAGPVLVITRDGGRTTRCLLNIIR